MSDPGTQSRNTSCTHRVVRVTGCPLCREERLRAALAEAVERVAELEEEIKQERKLKMANVYVAAAREAQVAEALSLLRELEFPVLDTNEDPVFCQFCSGHRRAKSPKHSKACRLDAFLKKHAPKEGA